MAWGEVSALKRRVAELEAQVRSVLVSCLDSASSTRVCPSTDLPWWIVLIETLRLDLDRVPPLLLQPRPGDSRQVEPRGTPRSVTPFIRSVNASLWSTDRLLVCLHQVAALCLKASQFETSTRYLQEDKADLLQTSRSAEGARDRAKFERDRVTKQLHDLQS